MAVLIPGPTVSGSTLRYSRDRASTVGCIGGTTHEMMTPSMRGSIAAVPNSPWSSTPCSSTVRSGSVCRRQCRTSSWPRYTPSTVLVLPTSIARSIAAPADPAVLLCPTGTRRKRSTNDRASGEISTLTQASLPEQSDEREKALIRRGCLPGARMAPRLLSTNSGKIDETGTKMPKRLHDSRDDDRGGNLRCAVAGGRAEYILGIRSHPTQGGAALHGTARTPGSGSSGRQESAIADRP